MNNEFLIDLFILFAIGFIAALILILNDILMRDK